LCSPAFLSSFWLFLKELSGLQVVLAVAGICRFTVHGRLAGSYKQAAVFQVGFLPPGPVKAVLKSADKFS